MVVVPKEMTTSASVFRPMGRSAALDTKRVKGLIWLYLGLLFGEGILRKWGLTALEQPLLLVRVPIALAMIYVGIASGLLIRNRLLAVFTWLGGIAFAVGACVAPNPLTAVYGWLCDFLPIPVIFIIVKTFDEDDFARLWKWLMILSLPHAFLMTAQYLSSPSSILNATPDHLSKQIGIAGDHVRPAGVFSQAVGPALFYALVTAFALAARPRGVQSTFLRYLGLAGVLWALVFSGSRMAWFECLTVAGVFFAMTVVSDYRKVPRAASLLAVLLGGLTFALSVPAVSSSMGLFWTSRVQSQTDLVDRLFGNFEKPLALIPDMPVLGYGLGVGTTVGAFLSGVPSIWYYGDAESDWARHVIESGPILGSILVIVRLLAIALFFGPAWRRLKAGNALPIALWALSGSLLLGCNLGQATENGFFTVTLGLLGASIRLSGERRSDARARPLPKSAVVQASVI